MEEQYEIFEKYIEGEMTAEESTSFENNLTTDQNLSDEFELFKSLRSDISIKIKSKNNEENLRETLTELNSKYFEEAAQPKAKVVNMNRRILLTAVALAACLLLVFLVVNPFERPLYDQFAQLPAAHFAERGSDPDNLITAQGLYNQDEYENAIAAFDLYLSSKPDDIEVKLYRAISLMQTNKFDKAISELTVIKNGDSIFTSEAKWFLALTHLKMGNKERVKDLLSEIGEDEERYVKAQRLMKKL